MLKHLTKSNSSPRTDLPLEIHEEKELQPVDSYCGHTARVV